MLMESWLSARLCFRLLGVDYTIRKHGALSTLVQRRRRRPLGLNRLSFVIGLQSIIIDYLSWCLGSIFWGGCCHVSVARFCCVVATVSWHTVHCWCKVASIFNKCVP